MLGVHCERHWTAWQAAQAPRDALEWRPALGTFAALNGGPAPLFKTVARHWLFMLSRATLMRFAEYGRSTFDVLWALSADILGVEAATLFVAFNKRVASFAHRARWAEDLTERGEAAELLDTAGDGRAEGRPESEHRGARLPPMLREGHQGCLRAQLWRPGLSQEGAPSEGEAIANTDLPGAPGRCVVRSPLHSVRIGPMDRQWTRELERTHATISVGGQAVAAIQ